MNDTRENEDRELSDGMISFQAEHVIHTGAVGPTAEERLAVSSEQREAPRVRGLLWIR